PLAGHTGWGVELGDGSWLAGTFDGPEMEDGPGIVKKGHNNDSWRHRFTGPTAEADMRNWFLRGETGKVDAQGRDMPQVGYDQYMEGGQNGLGDKGGGFAFEGEALDWGYGVVGKNWADFTY